MDHPAPPQPNSLNSLNEDKITAFVIGTQKKSRFQKAREAAEAKKRSEEAEAATVYESFVASFDGGDTRSRGGSINSFVRGGNNRDSGSGGRGEVYTFGKTANVAEDTLAAGSPAFVQTGSRTAACQEMRSLLEEIKSRHEASGSVSGTGSSDGSGDRSRPGEYSESTNLHVNNVSPRTTEEELMAAFRPFGRVVSIKVMWPRAAEERARGRNSGFVAFSHRDEAQDALDALDGSTLHGHRLTVGWARAVRGTGHRTSTSLSGSGSMRVTVVPSLEEGEETKTDLAASSSSCPPVSVSAASGTVATAGPSSEPSVSVGVGSLACTPAMHLLDEPRVYVRLPPPSQLLPSVGCAGGDQEQSCTVQALVALVARYVAQDGASAEDAILRHVAGNPDFDFMAPLLPPWPLLPPSLTRRADSETDCPLDPWQLQLYYRWAVYATLMGDAVAPPTMATVSDPDYRPRRWRTEPFQLQAGGVWVVPPPLPPLSEEERRWVQEREIEEKGDGRRRRSRAEMETLRREEQVRFAGLTGTQIERIKREEQRRKLDDAVGVDEDPGSAFKRSRSERVFGLTRADAAALRSLLADLSLGRAAVGGCMAWCLDHIVPLEQHRQQTAAQLVQDIGDILRQSLLDYMTPWSVKLARLFVCHDILLNAGTSLCDVSKFRSYFLEALPLVFVHLGWCFRVGVRGRMTARAVEAKVLAVLAVWVEQSVFTPQFCGGLEATFLGFDVSAAGGSGDGTTDESVTEEELVVLRRRAKLAGICWSLPSGIVGNLEAVELSVTDLRYKLAAVERGAQTKERGAVQTGVAGVTDSECDVSEAKLGTVNHTVGGADSKDDIDGEPIDIDGEPIDIDGKPIDIDGEPIDIDGEPIDIGKPVDIDGEPIDIDGEPIDIDGKPVDIDGEPL